MVEKYDRFFTPYVGPNYYEGVMGKKVLVVGASFYCTKTSCPNFQRCTSVIHKDSSPFNTQCIVSGYRLSDAPTNELESEFEMGTYKKFFGEMKIFTHTSTCKDARSHFAFTNYAQFFVPPKKTDPSYLTERDYYAFIEVLKELKPDIVIIWGVVVSVDFIWRARAHGVEMEFFEESEGYLIRIKLSDMDKKIMLINPYHPSSPHWYGKDHKNLKNFEKYFAKILKE